MKNRKSQPSFEHVEAVGDLVRRAQVFYQEMFGGRDTTCPWAAHEAMPNTWIAFPMGAEPHCLTNQVTGVTYEVSAYAAGLVCTGMAISSYRVGTKNREVIAVAEEAIFRLHGLVVVHPECDQILALAGVVV